MQQTNEENEHRRKFTKEGSAFERFKRTETESKIFLLGHIVFGLAYFFLRNAVAMISVLSSISVNLLRPRLAALTVSGQCFLSKNAKKKKKTGLPQYLWDERHLQELLKDGYTHEPLRY